MTTEARIRNGIHYFIGGVFAYCVTNATINNMNEVQTFILSLVVGGMVGGLIGTAIEIYQNWFIGQKYDNKDIKRTIIGGLIGGLLFVCQSDIKLITVYLFWACVIICVSEIIRSQIAKK